MYYLCDLRFVQLNSNFLVFLWKTLTDDGLSSDEFSLSAGSNCESNFATSAPDVNITITPETSKLKMAFMVSALN